MTTIITKNSSTASAVPAAGVLTQGELAVNVTDKKLYTKNSSGAVVEIGPTTVATANALTTARTIGGTSFDGTADILVGLASEATILQNTRAISLSGGVTGTVNFNGSAPVDIVSTVNFAINNPTSTFNVTLGASAGAALTTASQATLIGNEAGKAITTPTANTAVGHQALLTNIVGTGNTAIGTSAMNKVTGNYNTAIGNFTGNALTSAFSNTLLGDSAGNNLTTGSSNICIGLSSFASSPTVSNEITLGGNSISALRCNVTSISSLSDARDKTDIVDTAYGVDFLNTLQPRQFKWATRDGSPKDGKVEQGFIAQELLEAAGVDKNKLNLVYESNPEKLEDTAGNLIPILVKAIQELSARVTELENN